MNSQITTTITTTSLPFNPSKLLLHRRSLLLLTTTTTTLSLPSISIASPPPKQPDTTITDRVFMDFSICPSYFQTRTLGSDLASCPDSEPVGRIVLGLYGNFVPITVSNFKAMCTGMSGYYKGTLIQKLFPGNYFMAGKQGRRDKGEVKPPVNLVRNTESIDPKAFELRHTKGGVLSLCLSENDDDDDIKLDPNYSNVEFMITTGPGPCPDLDGRNIVFGTVLEGMDVVASINSIPTYKPGERVRQYNDLAEFFGDERARNARAIWDRPQKTLYISNCGEVKVTKPTLSPSLP
ncbi:peptidyl-prolyl cis-trans isomerase CYP28, chloroplastic-like [Rutidosis leptorrhynchoides]|uniref:peptidyl-prolyl cis-trans isomerase CYP28, chloroplastic-like n=1 Tax=Rutidosis leptorrhynchoides TaxID=125765 RepID=UPI003A99DFFD